VQVSLNATAPYNYLLRPSLTSLSPTAVVVTLGPVPPSLYFVPFFPVLYVSGVRATSPSTAFLTYSSGLNVTALSGCSFSRVLPTSTFNCNQGQVLSIQGSYFMQPALMNVTTTAPSVVCQSLRWVSAQLMTCVFSYSTAVAFSATDVPLRLLVSYATSPLSAPVLSLPVFTMAPPSPVVYSARGCMQPYRDNTTSQCSPGLIVTITGDNFPPSVTTLVVRLAPPSLSPAVSLRVASVDRTSIRVFLPSVIDSSSYNVWLSLQVTRITTTGDPVASNWRPLLQFWTAPPSIFSVKVSGGVGRRRLGYSRALTGHGCMGLH
jgi:hypothetical protein